MLREICRWLGLSLCHSNVQVVSKPLSEAERTGSRVALAFRAVGKAKLAKRTEGRTDVKIEIGMYNTARQNGFE